jgi:hypothetical protein
MIAVRGIPLVLNHLVAGDFAYAMSHHYIECTDNHRKGIVNDWRGTNGLNVHKLQDYQANPVVLQCLAVWRSST